MRDLQNAGSLGKIIVQLFHFCFEFWETGDSGFPSREEWIPQEENTTAEECFFSQMMRKKERHIEAVCFL